MRDQVVNVAEKGIPVVPVDDVEKAALDAGVSQAQASAIADEYGDAQLQGLKRAIGAVAIFALLSLWFTRGLPGRALAPERTPPESEPEPQPSVA